MIDEFRFARIFETYLVSLQQGSFILHMIQFQIKFWIRFKTAVVIVFSYVHTIGCDTRKVVFKSQHSVGEFISLTLEKNLGNKYGCDQVGHIGCSSG